MSQSLTDETYWNSHWQQQAQPVLSGRSGYAEQVSSRIYDKAFRTAKPGDLCLEVGCGNSEHLILIARRYGLQVWGLDYSAEGCELARRRLQEAGVEGQICQRDLFEPNEDLQNKFDCVVSFGVVEHFEDTLEPLRAIRRLVKAGGTILTTTPNVDPASLNVRVMKHVGPKILAMHKLMTLDQLRSFHEACGFKTVSCEYEGMGLSLASDEPEKLSGRLLGRVAFRGVQLARKGRELLRLRPRATRWTGLLMVYVGRA
jgi:cyclopropane fatty-acyl-phospholipid synthase-like methyltransferase